MSRAGAAAASLFAGLLLAGCSLPPLQEGYPKGILDTQLFVVNRIEPASGGKPAGPGRLLLVAVNPEGGLRIEGTERKASATPTDWIGFLADLLRDRVRGREPDAPSVFSAVDVQEYTIPYLPGPEGIRDIGRRAGASHVLLAAVSANGIWERNALGFLDWLVLPRWVVPGHIARSFTTVEGRLFEVETGRILLSFERRGSARTLFARAVARERALREVQAQAEATALEALASDAAARVLGPDGK